MPIYLYYILMVLIAAGIGWLTNIIAVKMLFHPKEPLDLYFYKLQGVFPKRQLLIAKKIGKVVADELLSFDDLKERITGGKSLELVRDNIAEKMDFFIEEKLPKKFPLLSLLMRKKMKEEIRSVLLAELDERLPVMLDNYINNVEQEIDIEQMISDRFSQLSSEKLETVMHEILDKEFRFIEYIGLALGFLIGCLQVGLLMLQGM